MKITLVKDEEQKFDYAPTFAAAGWPEVSKALRMPSRRLFETAVGSRMLFSSMTAGDGHYGCMPAGMKMN